MITVSFSLNARRPSGTHFPKPESRLSRMFRLPPVRPRGCEMCVNIHLRTDHDTYSRR